MAAFIAAIHLFAIYLSIKLFNSYFMDAVNFICIYIFI